MQKSYNPDAVRKKYSSSCWKLASEQQHVGKYKLLLLLPTTTLLLCTRIGALRAALGSSTTHIFSEPPIDERPIRKYE